MTFNNLLTVVISILTFPAAAQHRLEPQDGSILHCAGQTNQDFTDMDGFEGYSKYLKNNTKPEVFMIYLALNQVTQDWFNQLEGYLQAYNDMKHLKTRFICLNLS